MFFFFLGLLSSTVKDCKEPRKRKKGKAQYPSFTCTYVIKTKLESVQKRAIRKRQGEILMKRKSTNTTG